MKFIGVFIASLLTARVYAGALSSPRISPSESRNISYRREILIGENEPVRFLEIYDQEEPADAVYRFGKLHGLEDWQRGQILDSVCELLLCQRTKALLWSSPVSISEDKIETVQVLEGVEAADAVHAFMKEHNLHEGYRNVLLAAACQYIECTRTEPVIWKKSVSVDSKWNVNIEILRGQEPAEVIYSALRPHGVSYSERRKIFQQAMEDGVPHSADAPLLFSKNITLQDDSFSGVFTMHDNGEEPVDVIYNFAKAHSIEEHFTPISQALLPTLCELVACARNQPIIWGNEIKDDQQRVLGRVEILRGEEAIDVIDRFVQHLSVDLGDRYAFRKKLLDVVCESISCSRLLPVVYRKTITGDNRKPLGEMEIFEGEEVIDAAVRFIRGLENVSVDEIALKNYFLGDACKMTRLKCTRNVGVVFKRLFHKEDNSAIGTLIVHENEEPADKVYQWCQENHLGMGYFKNIIDMVCDSELVICRRRDPILLSIPIRGPEGEFIDTFELKVGQEPVDGLFGFFAKNGLFQKKWDFHGVFQQICAMNAVECKRLKAVKHYDSNFTIGEVNVGPLIIWEDQEVVDVLYSLRKEYNLTETQQMTSFIDICKKPEVLCERSKAKIFEKTEITKLDYEKFGNETCSRQFVGVKFRSSFVNMPLGSRVAEFLKDEEVKVTMEHPLFCILLLFLLQILAHGILRHPSIEKQVHPGVYIAVIFWLFILVSVLQAVLVEPDNDVDQAMHTYEGKLPDLVVYENEEPVDALIKWGKEAARKHHPIVREPIYHEILDELCNQAGSLTCTRSRAWESLNMGSMTYFGVEFQIEYFNPDVDPISRQQCYSNTNVTLNSCVDNAAKQFCRRLVPQPNNCKEDITNHMISQLEKVDSNRLDAKCSYKRLGLEMDAPGRELYKKAASVANMRGMNISPFRRADNRTGAERYTWAKTTREAHAAIDTFHKIKDPESREWNDKPCEPVLGGALCAKTDKDGNMMIEV